MRGIRCHGPELGQQPAESPQACREQCSNREGCVAWSFNCKEGVCSLKGFCDYLVPTSETLVAGKLVAKPQNLRCTMPQENFDCWGHDLDVIQDTDFDGCCQRCAATAGCFMFSVSFNICYLKGRCLEKRYTDISVSGFMQRPGRDVFDGYFKVARSSFKVQGYICGDGAPSTAVFFPQGDGPFGLVAFRAGTGGFEDHMGDWLETIASLGLVVLMPFTGRGTCRGPDGKGHAYQDLLTLLSVAYESGTALHPVMGKVDWQRVGVMGHSMGAKAALMAAAKSRSPRHFRYHHRVRVIAVVASHDSADAERLPEDVAAMFNTGSNDGSQYWLKDQYNACPSRSKVLANLDHGHHMEPVPDFMVGWGNGCARQNFWTGLFLSCHLGLRQAHCDRVYGREEGSMRQVNVYTQFSAVGWPRLEPSVPAFV